MPAMRPQRFDQGRPFAYEVIVYTDRDIARDQITQQQDAGQCPWDVRKKRDPGPAVLDVFSTMALLTKVTGTLHWYNTERLINETKEMVLLTVPSRVVWRMLKSNDLMINTPTKCRRHTSEGANSPHCDYTLLKVTDDFLQVKYNIQWPIND